LLVVRVCRVPVEVVPHAELLDVLLVERVIPLRDDVRGHPFLVGPDRHGSPMHIAPPDHEDLVPFHPVVPREDIRRDERRDRVAEVSRPGRVRPGDADEDLRYSRRVKGRRLILNICLQGLAPIGLWIAYWLLSFYAISC